MRQFIVKLSATALIAASAVAAVQAGASAATSAPGPVPTRGLSVPGPTDPGPSFTAKKVSDPGPRATGPGLSYQQLTQRAGFPANWRLPIESRF
jgi:hypothetical protein